MRMPNGYGSVVKLGGNRRKPFAARVTVGWTEYGKQKYKYIGYYASRQEALAALADFNRDPSSAAKKRVTLADAYAGWSLKKLESASESTVKSYRSAWKLLEPLHNRDITSISTDVMQALVDDLAEKYGGSTLLNVKRMLTESFKWAEQRDIVAKNYAEFIVVKRSPQSDIHKPFSDAEVRKVLDLAKAGNEHARIVSIMLYTGVRISELIKQDTSAIDLDARMMIGGVKTSAGKNRRIPIHRDILQYVAERKEMGRYLVMSVKGTSCMARSVFIRNIWKPLMNEIGADHKPHDTRSTFSTGVLVYCECISRNNE